MKRFQQGRKYMNDRVFLDTNILIYSQFPQSNEKQKIAQSLILQCVKSKKVYISTQVLGEFINVATKKNKYVG